MMNVCEVEVCERPARSAKGGLCAAHYMRERTGKPLDTPIAHRGRGEHIGYRAAHHRIDRARGKAVNYECEAGCGRPAAEWSLNPDTPDLLWEAKPETGVMRPYALDVLSYSALCIPCHRLRDDNQPPRRVAA